MSRRLIALILFFGFFVGFGSGLIENPDASNYSQQIVYYGFPLGWRSVNNISLEKNAYPVQLIVDVIFGMAVISLIAASYALTQRRVGKKVENPDNRNKNPRKVRFMAVCIYSC